MMKIYELPCGDEVHRYKKCIVVPFKGKRTVLSTCPLNGGYRTGLTAVFNNDGNPGAGMACTLRAPTYGEHMAIIADEIGLDRNTASGMSTAASMENVSIKTEAFAETSVTAIVTGGIEVNGGRVGDPASWHEQKGKAVPVKQGTINIMLFINVNLSEGAMTRAVVTCTEAKTAAIQELLAPSRYSMGLATGSGTDGTIVVCNAESDITLTNAGKHSKLGELIGKAVKSAVKEALKLQSGLSPESQHNMLKRIDRFGITEDSLWKLYSSRNPEISRAEFENSLWKLSQDSDMVVYSSLYAHILDQLMWEMISSKEAVSAAEKLIGLIMHRHSTELRSDPDSGDVLLNLIDGFKEAICDKLSV
ncbi:MAG: adenosylcobinamide amidohydrolase [Ruminiclostridium sp.]